MATAIDERTPVLRIPSHRPPHTAAEINQLRSGEHEGNTILTFSSDQEGATGDVLAGNVVPVYGDYVRADGLRDKLKELRMSNRR